MGFGFFGKVPQKGDFLVIDLPLSTLHPLETWLEEAVASSKTVLGQAWHNAFLVAPIWRFWLPARVLGRGCAGALVSSVDSGGRYFPAVLIFLAELQGEISHPSAWRVDDWMTGLDQRLLTMLRAEDAGYLSSFTAGLPQPERVVGQRGEHALWWVGSYSDRALSVPDGFPPPSDYARMLAPDQALNSGQAI